MPQPFPAPSLPWWADPAYASVMDPWYIAGARTLASLLAGKPPPEQP